MIGFMVVRMAEDNKHYVVISIDKLRGFQEDYRDQLNGNTRGDRYEVIPVSVVG